MLTDPRTSADGRSIHSHDNGPPKNGNPIPVESFSPNPLFEYGPWRNSSLKWQIEKVYGYIGLGHYLGFDSLFDQWKLHAFMMRWVADALTVHYHAPFSSMDQGYKGSLPPGIAGEKPIGVATGWHSHIKSMSNVKASRCPNYKYKSQNQLTEQ